MSKEKSLLASCSTRVWRANHDIPLASLGANFLSLSLSLSNATQHTHTHTHTHTQVAFVGKLDPRKRLQSDLESLMSANIVQSLGTMLDAVVFAAPDK